MLDELKSEIIEYGKLLGGKNYSPGTSGNISMRFEDKILITSSGSANSFLNKYDIVLIDFDGNLVEGNKKPSSEKMLHASFYWQRADVNCIIHVHSPYLSTFACMRKALDEPVMAENVFYFGQIPLANYGLPSSDDLVEKTSIYFKDYDVVMLANHGVIAGADSMKNAYLKLELAESYAQVVFNTKLLGGAVLLNAKEIEEINSLK